MTTATRAAQRTTRSTRRKKRFDIDDVIRRIRATIAERGVADAAMFALAEEGYTSLFEQLVACVISIRTFDEISLPTAKNLFAVARTPLEISRLSVQQIDELIRPATFHEPKAKTIHDIARKVLDD